MNKTKHNQKGQSFIEFLIVMPMFFIILLGLFEFIFIYKAKVTFNTATFEAARAGSLDHGKSAAMLVALAKGMAPLYMKGDSSADTIGMSAAYLQARAAASAINLLPGIEAVEIISPSAEVIDQFSVERTIKVEGESNYRRVTMIPSDNLYFRSSIDIPVKTGSDSIMMNIQDANLLKIRTLWCYRMITPLIPRLIRSIVTNPLMTATAPAQNACNAGSFITGGSYLALRSHAVIRMQTHFIKEDF